MLNEDVKLTFGPCKQLSTHVGLEPAERGLSQISVQNPGDQDPPDPSFGRN